MTYNKGIFHAIRERSTVVEFGKAVTRESIMQALNFVSKKSPREVIFYTGLQGAYIFDWTVTFGETIKEIHYHHSFKHISFRYISLFKKESLYKIKIIDNTFSFYKGVTLIHTIENVRNQYVLSDAMNNVKETQTKLDEVNTYIKKLKKVYEKEKIA